MQFSTILYDVTDGVATVTFNRPESMNSWTPTMSDELAIALGQADADDAVRVVIITGTGRAFCAGADLSQGESGFAAGQAQGRPELKRLWPHQVRKPVIAALNGHAIGVGITLPILCDIRIAAVNAKIQLAMVRRGIVPELGSHFLLPRIMGFSRAADLILSGRIITGAEAAEMGLVSQALPAEQVLPAALAMARDIAANTAPVSVALAKRFLWDGLSSSHVDIMAREHVVLPKLTALPDAKEGVTAFFEKRAPQWTLKVSKDLDAMEG